MRRNGRQLDAIEGKIEGRRFGRIKIEILDILGKRQFTEVQNIKQNIRSIGTWNLARGYIDPPSGRITNKMTDTFQNACFLTRLCYRLITDY